MLVNNKILQKLQEEDGLTETTIRDHEYQSFYTDEPNACLQKVFSIFLEGNYPSSLTDTKLNSCF